MLKTNFFLRDEFARNKIYSIDNELLKRKNTDLHDYQMYRINLINNCLFVVKDINLLSNEVRKYYPSINEGVQGQRGEVNEMDSFLNSIEIDYLDSLYNNHKYHTEEKED